MHLGDDKVPGLVALVAHGDQVQWRRSGGLAIGGRPVERGSLFRIASTTKPITAAATLALVREGLVELDEPVDRLLPELASRRVLHRVDGPLEDTLPAAGPVTVRGLLTLPFGFGMAMERLRPCNGGEPSFRWDHSQRPELPGRSGMMVCRRVRGPDCGPGTAHLRRA